MPPSRPARTRFALRLTLAMPALALTLRRPVRHTPADHLLAVLRWILRTDLRTWTPLTVLVGWMIVETDDSLIDAAIPLITRPSSTPESHAYARSWVLINRTSPPKGAVTVSPVFGRTGAQRGRTQRSHIVATKASIRCCRLSGTPVT